MAIPQIELETAGQVRFRFTYQSCGFFTASLVTPFFGVDPLTVVSDNIRLQKSSSSRFEVFFDKALFEFPHTELKKFQTFLDEVKTIKDAA